MKISQLTNAPQWLLDAKTSDEDVEIIRGKVHWFSGNWHEGTWENGTWMAGTWYAGTWLDGMWLHGDWKGGTWRMGNWKGLPEPAVSK